MENDNIKRKDPVKGKIILLIIGVLVGAIISTAGFIAYSLTLSNNNSNSSQQMPSGGGTPPEMPNSNNSGQTPSGTPPEMPSGENSNNASNNNQSN